MLKKLTCSIIILAKKSKVNLRLTKNYKIFLKWILDKYKSIFITLTFTIMSNLLIFYKLS
jgi:hypothetical protein